MAWGKKEETIYPPLKFKLGDFIRDKVEMKNKRKQVVNTFYYEKGIVVKGYEYNFKSRLMEVFIRQYIQKKPEEIKVELTSLMITEELNRKLKLKEKAVFVKK